MSRRASTDYSFVVGIDKPAGMTSHDVVDRCRRIYGERRCGHTGTLDPAATGAMAVCVGPATRLDPYLTGHDKSYEFTIAFGSATDTDDAEGEVTRTAPVAERIGDPEFASSFVAGLVGKSKQMPPVYSAIKVGGRKSCDEARNGKIIDLVPRDIEIFDAELREVRFNDEGLPLWVVVASVSAGTYIRSIARDAGATLGTCAHVESLRRVRSGNLLLGDCVSLESLESDPFGALLDPVKLLGTRFIFADVDQTKAVANGCVLPREGLDLYAYDSRIGQNFAMCGCTSGVHPADGQLAAGEHVSVVADNRLKAIYEYDAHRNVLKSRCGFATGVKRGCDI